MLKRRTQDEWILESPVVEGKPFTDSDPWRVFRIMGEFVEGFDTMAGLAGLAAQHDAGGREYLRP